MEKEIELEQEPIQITTGGAVNSVNGQTGDVVLTTSDLENTSDYQNGTEVESAINTAIGQIDIPTKTSDLTNDGADGTSTYVEATALTAETTARQNADNNLQNQIDAISASSDVTDIVGTKAELNAYDTSKLKDNDIIKVLQDESQNDETTYYRWSTTTQSFTLIGEEGPYYTKSQADVLLNAKQNTLTAGSNISIVNDTISATDTTYTAGNGLALNGTQFSVDTTTIATQSDLTAGLATKQDTLTAGANVQINNNTISATDTTYSDFTGTDGTAAGTAGLVPAPATTDAGKFLKADGTWDTAGSTINVVQTTGISTTDVMSQNAVTSMVYADPSTRAKIQLGYNASANGTGGVAAGYGAAASGGKSVAFGESASVSISAKGSVALGAYSNATRQGEVNVGAITNWGYNNSQYRLLSGLYDGQSAHDAATVGQLDARVLQNAGAPTTATVGTVGQLLEDTTNGKLYQCTVVSGSTYTWSEVGAGGSSVNVVQSTGTSTTDVMSQNATTSMVFADPATQHKIKIGAGTSTSEGSDGIEIGHLAYADAENSVSLGRNAGSSTTAIGGVAIGANTYASGVGTIALGASSGGNNLPQGVMTIGPSNTYYGYNSTNYRLLTGLYDPQSAHDAATKGYVDPTTDSSAPTNATVGRLGQIQIDTTNADAYMCVAVDDVTPSYTWKAITA